MMYGQWVIGPPGSGKTTYCYGMQQMCVALNRKHFVVNLDPANDFLPYECAIDLKTLIDCKDVMKEQCLGPNGALIYCIEFLLENFSWLSDKLRRLGDGYVLFDCPGQVELYTHHEGMATILQKLQKMDYRLSAIHLVDSTLCTDPYKYISALLVSLAGQIHLELPHINVLTKIDLLKNFSKELDFRIDYYAEVGDLENILILMKDKNPFAEKFHDFNSKLCETIQDFNLISFRLLDIQEKHSVLNLLKEIDNSNGFSLGTLHSDLDLFNIFLSPFDSSRDSYGDIQEKYIDSDD